MASLEDGFINMIGCNMKSNILEMNGYENENGRRKGHHELI